MRYIFVLFVFFFKVQAFDNDNFFLHLHDFYNYFYINHVIDDQHEYIDRFISDKNESELFDYFNELILECRDLKNIDFDNDTLHDYAIKFIESSIKFYHKARVKDFFDSEDYTIALQEYSNIENKFLEYFIGRYPFEFFLDIDQDKLFERMNKHNFIHQDEYDYYESLKNEIDDEKILLEVLNKYNLIDTLTFENWKILNEEKIKKSIDYLIELNDATVSYLPKTIYQIEIADQYFINRFKVNIDSSVSKASAIYFDIINSPRYSLFMVEAWRKWRVLEQTENYGSSTWSAIPNDQYNAARKKIATTILSHLKTTPNDTLAIYQYLWISSHDIVKRFGEYQYGNQIAVESYYLFR